MKKYLDQTGLETLVSNIKTYVGTQVSPIKTSVNNTQKTADDINNRFTTFAGSTTKMLKQDNTIAGAVEFAGSENTAEVLKTSMVVSSTSEGYSVVYSTNKNVFVLKNTSNNTYYNNWLDADQFGIVDATDNNGRVPYKTKIYFCNNSCYYWDGTYLVKTIDGTQSSFLTSKTGCLRFDTYVIGTFAENSVSSFEDDKIYYVQTLGTSSSSEKGAFCRKGTDGKYHANGDLTNYNDFSGDTVKPRANTLFINSDCELYITAPDQNTITSLSISDSVITEIFK